MTETPTAEAPETPPTDPNCALCDTDRHVCPGCGANTSHGEPVCARCAADTAAVEAIVGAASEPAPEAAPAPEYRVLGRETRRFDFPLSADERARVGDHVGDLGRRLRELEREDKVKSDQAKARIAAEKTKASEAASKRRDEIEKAAEEFDTALEAQTSGIEWRSVECERREMADGSTAVVRLDTGEVIATFKPSPPDTELRQADIADATDGATVPVSPTGEHATPEDDTRRTDKGNRCVGWPVAWEGATWPVQVDDQTVTLTEPHVWEVYVQTPSDGEPVTAGSVAKRTEYQRQCVVRALDLLRGKGLAKQVGKKWLTVIPSASPEVSAEGGRKDDLPAAGDIVRVRLSEPGTKADALLANAVDASATYAP